MKAAIFGILGLLLGIGGGSAMAVMQAKKSFAAYDAKRARVVADSIELAAGHGAAPDSSHAGDSTQVATADSAHGPAADSAGKAHGAPTVAAQDHAAPAADAHAPAPPKATDSHGTPAREPMTRQRAVATVESRGATAPAGGKPAPPARPLESAGLANPTNARLGKIFGAMPPKDAARVLEQLGDGEVHEILKSLPDKQAAGIMQFLPPARAAAISKLALKGGHE